MIDTIKIPEERTAVLIGKKGSVKRHIFKKYGVKLTIKGSEVKLEGEPFNIYIVKKIVKAIGRGFSPEKAYLLGRDDYQLEVLEIKDYVHTKNALIRLRGRVIGREGTAKEKIEKLTHSYISVYGKTVAIIGDINYIHIAVEAIDMLLRGSKHGTVYRFIENRIKHINR